MLLEQYSSKFSVSASTGKTIDRLNRHLDRLALGLHSGQTFINFGFQTLSINIQELTPKELNPPFSVLIELYKNTLVHGLRYGYSPEVEIPSYEDIEKALLIAHNFVKDPIIQAGVGWSEEGNNGLVVVSYPIPINASPLILNEVVMSRRNDGALVSIANGILHDRFRANGLNNTPVQVKDVSKDNGTLRSTYVTFWRENDEGSI